MARLRAEIKGDVATIDLRPFSKSFVSGEFLDDAFVRYNGQIYQDVYFVEGRYPPGTFDDLDLLLGGTNFRFDSDGRPISGKVTGIIQENGAFDPFWEAENFSVPLVDFYNAAVTSSRKDDLKVMKSILSGDDKITGTARSWTDETEGAVLSGYSGSDTIKGSSGHDILKGGKGMDAIYGRGGNDVLKGGKGKDELFCRTGDDRLKGGTGKDVLHGGRGDDRLNGGAQSDVIDGGRGADVLIGGKGADTFIFDERSGQDIVRDFGGRDEILITSGASSFEDLTLNESSVGVIISFGAVEILLEDKTLAEITSSDFDFG